VVSDTFEASQGRYTGKYSENIAHKVDFVPEQCSFAKKAKGGCPKGDGSYGSAYAKSQ